MVEEGYAAVSARKVAGLAGVDVALVYYYFANMDDLFIALFRQGTERSLERQAQVLASVQPLWGLWDLLHQQSNSVVTMEFIALANHRKAIHTEIVETSRRLRTMQIEVVKKVLKDYGVDEKKWPAASIILIMTGTSRLILTEDAFDLDSGHAETIALIERYISALEGPRRDLSVDAASEPVPLSF
jgi:AcrR family transcriptional regulator